MRYLRNVVKGLCVAGIAMSLIACDRAEWQNRWEMRYGPRNAFETEQVDASNNRQRVILSAFVARAGYGDRTLLSSEEWYQTMLAGMGYVDEVCDAYIQELSIAAREKGRIDSLLAKGTAVTAAVLQATSPGSKAISIVAQGFLLSRESTTVFADSYLYRLPPSTILNITRELRKGYRVLVIDRKAVYGTPFAAYAGVRGYLMQCLPATIDAKIDDILKSSKFAYEPDNAALFALPRTITPTPLAKKLQKTPVMEVPVASDPK